MLPQARLEDYSRPPSYRSRSSGGHANNGEYGHDGTSGSRPSMDPGIGHNHHSHHNHHPHAHIIESPMHSRDPSLLSYLSQQSVDNMSVVSGHHGNPGGTATVVTVVQAVSVGMDIGLGSTLGPYEGDDDGKGRVSLEAVDDKSCYDPDDSKDGNLVRIVQTTDSSQVIGRDSVIVTVSGGDGSNPTMWDTYHIDHHHLSRPTTTYAAITNGPVTNNNTISNNSSNTIVTTTSPSSSSNERDQQGGSNGNSSSAGNGTSEVQILAHL